MSARKCPHHCPASTRASSTTRKHSSGFISGKGADAGDRPAEDQGVDIVRALVSVHRFEVHRVADDMIFGRDTVAAVHVACAPRDIVLLAPIVSLVHSVPVVLHPAFFFSLAHAHPPLPSPPPFFPPFPPLHLPPLFLP